MMQQFAAWGRAWGTIAPRERRLVSLAALVAALGLLWLVGIAPAFRILASAPAQMQKLDAQLQTMNQLAEQAKSLRGRPTMTRDEALRALGASVQQRLGASGQLLVSADRATVTIKAAAPDVLAQWLSQARVSARAVAVQARLSRGEGGWDGTVVLELPPPT